MRAIGLAAALGLAMACISKAETLTLVSDRDNTLYDDGVGGLSNGAGEYFFVGRTAAGGIRRGLLRFDLSPIPQGAVVSDVTLRLHMSRTSVEFAPVSLHRAGADWGEGTSNAGERGGIGSAATPGDATWVHRFYSAAFWDSAGGDFAPLPSATTAVNGTGFWTWGSSAAMIADVSFWIENPAENFGWCLLGDEIETSAKRFDTRENIDSSVRPRLTIHFELPDCTGDLNGDGSRDLADLALLLSGFGTPSGAMLADGDIDGDEDVDLGDLAIMLSVFGSPC